MEGKLTPDLSPVSPSTPSVDSSVCMNNTDKSISCNHVTTLRGGSELGTMRPHWLRVTESEQRITWLKTMGRKDLVVRDLESYARSIGAKLRSEEYKMREE